ncbi:MAG: putative Ig domain-containing protein [Acidobacteriota bacterium]
MTACRLSLAFVCGAGLAWAQGRPSITTASLPGGAVGAPYSAALAATGGKQPYTWRVADGSLPTGLELGPNSGVIGGTPSAPGNFKFTVSVTDANNRTGRKALSISVAGGSAPLGITTASLPAGTVGTAYSAPLAALGGAPPYTWSATGLPGGLNLDAASGLIAGTPTQAGPAHVTVNVADSSGQAASMGYDLTIAAGLAITTGSLPGGTVGAAYSATLAASGGATPYTWSATGLPGGLSLNAQSGAIGGTPSAPGTFHPEIRVQDATGAAASRTYDVAIVATLAIATGSLPGGTVGTAYSATLAATGGAAPYAWSATGLPNGLSLNAQSGAIGGTPSAAGAFHPEIRVQDATGATASKTYDIAIAAGLAITTSPLPGAKTGTAYSATLSATGGTPPYTWSIASGTLPPGLKLDASSGAFSGTPSEAGSFTFTVQVADSRGVTKSLATGITVEQGLSITTSTLPDATLAAFYQEPLQAAGGKTPYTWSVAGGSLPGGLSLDSRSGAISGTPTVVGSFSFSVMARDASGDSSAKSFTITVVSGLTITSTSPLPPAAAGVPYSQALAAISGVAPYAWTVSAGSLPNGIALNRSTGLLSGTTTASARTYTFTVTVTDSASASDSREFSLTVVGALAVSTTTLPGASLRTPYSQTLSAVAGTSPYTWTVTEGALPPGLALSASGAISGTPATQGNYSFTVQVKDAVGTTAAAPLSIAVGPALSVTSGPALPPGALAAAYAATLAAAGGTPPYTWSIASGALPAGLALNASTGVISGTPAAAGNYTFTVTVTDSARATATANLSLAVAAQGVPAVTITGVSGTAGPLEQPALGLTLAKPYQAALAGQLTLSFAPDAAAPVDDPAIQFSTGGRTTSFTIPAGATQASFQVPSLQLQTGSVSGTITISVKLTAGGADITPNPAPAATIRIARAAPVIRVLRLVKTASGFEAWITGYATTRELTQATVQFTPASGSNLQTTSVTVPMGDASKQWFEDSGSAAYGSQFTIVQPFTGNAGLVASVSVTLASAAGASAAATAGF